MNTIVLYRNNGVTVEIELTRIFVKVVQNNSFSRAADILKMPKSTVSKAVTRLERETGTKLLMRTTRSLTLTAAGRGFYEASLGPILQLEDAQKSLHGQDSILTGVVKLTAPEDLGSFVIAPAIAELSQRHPDLRFELEYTDEIVDLVKDGFDLAVRIGRPTDSTLKLKRIGEVILIPVASAQYLKGKDKIRQPIDLTAHACFSVHIQGSTDRWTLKSAKGTVHVPIKSKISSNQMTSLMQMALVDGGVAFVPSFLCKQHIENGELIRLLPDWSGVGIPASIVTPLAPSSSARLKLTVDHLHSALSAALK